MDNENIIIDFLKSINIIDKSETTLENIFIKRSVLIDNIENYQDLSEKKYFKRLPSQSNNGYRGFFKVNVF